MEKRDVNGTVPDESLQSLVPVLKHYKKIFRAMEMGKVTQSEQIKTLLYNDRCMLR